jgi:class 3 adenylate cyclase/tetratricopeptide (TPR) repeat protein
MRFCGRCGAALGAPAQAAEQRKLVTVLFADVVGSTRLLRQFDPEQVQARLARFLGIARDEVRRFGGQVGPALGDGLMGVFGLPAIHEDDAERACRAALAILSRVRASTDGGPLPEIRIALDTGEALTQSAEPGEPDALTGEAVNIASRLQQHAAPGQILVGERTMQMVRHLADLRPLAPLAVKDVAEPLCAWELLAIAPARERRLRSTPFVNRDDDLALLRGLLRRVRREGRGHAVTILGAAGVGKSRLVREFRPAAEGMRVLRGRALPYGTGIPYWPLAESIREECGLLRADPRELACGKVEAAAARLGVADAVPALLSVLGIAGRGQDLTREVLFSGMHAFFRAVAQREPALLVMEDAHWAEDATLDYLEHAADALRDAPVLLLILARPDLLERRVQWMGGKRNATALSLHRLPDGESRALVLGILDAELAQGPFLDLVLERAEGNPLFMEEIVWGLIERRVLARTRGRWALTVPLPEVTVPDTVHAVIAARVDALPAAERQVLQDAAVVGKDFWPGALRVIGAEQIGEALPALAAKDLIVRKPRSTFLPEEELTFRHILIRDVAYAMIPKALRWPKHARFAEWLEQQVGERRSEYADIIAHHWLQVVRLQEDLGQAADPRARQAAIDNLLRAAERAAGLYANAAAVTRFSEALALGAAGGDRARALLGRGGVRMHLGQYEEAREDFAAAGALAREAGDARWEAVARDSLGVSFRRQDRIEEGLAHLQDALALARGLDDPGLTGRILNHIGFAYFSDGRHEEAIRAHDEARSLLERGPILADLAESFHGLGDNLFLEGRFSEALRWLVESARLSEEIGNRSLAAENRLVIAWTRRIRGEYAAARDEIGRTLETLREIGDVGNSAVALPVAAGIEATLGALGAALEHAAQGLALSRQIKAVRYAVYNLLWLGAVHRELEGFTAAADLDRQAADLTRTSRAEAFWLPVVHASLALDAAGLGDGEEARAHVDAAERLLARGFRRLDFAEEVLHARGRVMARLGETAAAVEAGRRLAAMAAGGHRYWEAPATLLLADAHAARGDLAEALRLYRRGADQCGAEGRLSLSWRMRAGLADAARAAGDRSEAERAGRAAEAIIRGLAAGVPEEPRAVFLGSQAVRRCLAAVSG